MTQLCTITGVVHDRGGDPVASTDLVITPLQPVNAGDNLLVPIPETFTTDGSGNITIELYTGFYSATFTIGGRSYDFYLTVPNAATATFAEITTLNTEISSSEYEKILEHLTAAQAARTQTENIYDSFRAVYLGSFETAPATADEGAFYSNTTDNLVYFRFGSSWLPLNGADGADGADGAPGPQGPQGPPGDEGPVGPQGSSGATILSGATTPTPAIGSDGDFYIDTALWRIHGPKASGTWPAGVSIVGETPPPVAPAFSTSPTASLSGRTLTVQPGTVSGSPTPGITAIFTLDGVPVTPSGTGPWSYTAPSAETAQTVAWEVTAANVAGNVSASGSEVVPADITPGAFGTPEPVTINSADATSISATLPADPTATGLVITDRVMALVPAGAYAGNEQNPAAWTVAGALYAGGLSAEATHVFTGSLNGDYVVTWEARDTTTDPRTDSDWSVGVATNVPVPSNPPTASTIVVGEQQSDGSVPLTITSPSEDATDSTFVFVPAGEPRPTTAQVRAGQKSDGTAAPISGAFAVTQVNPAVALSGLPDVDGTFDVYVVLGDNDGDFSPVPIDAGPVVLDFDPAAFVDADWSVATGAAGALDVTIGQLPANKGLTITDVEYDLDASGTWVSSGGTGDFSITGLTESQSYAVRLRAVNSNGAGAAGNSESASAGVAGSTTMTFLYQQQDTGTFETTHTFNHATNPAIPADLNGVKIVVSFSLRDGTNPALQSVVIGGTTATERAAATPWQRAYVYEAVGGTANDDIVITTAGNAILEICIYETDADFVAAVTAEDASGTAAPNTFDLSATTLPGDFAVGCFGGFGSTGITTRSFAGLTERGSGSEQQTRTHYAFDNLTGLSGGSPETINTTVTDGGTVYGSAVLAIYR